MPHANLSVFIPHVGCRERCSFCDQHRITGREKAPTAQEVAGLLEDAAAKYRGDPKDAEIAFFGGSFTAVPLPYMQSLLSAAAEICRRYGFSGIRCSTRPDAIDDERLTILKKYGVTAVELGAQSMDDGVLAKNRRGHTAEDVHRGAALIRRYGMKLGLQMMTGLPGDSDAGALETARQLLALHPGEMRIYPALVLENTELCDWYRAGEYAPQTLENAVDLCAKLIPMIEGAGVRLLKVGLHDSAETKDCVAGPYHPAFMELCRGKIFLDALLPELLARKCKTAVIAVAPKMLSVAKGHGKCNEKALLSKGIHVKFTPDESLSGRTYKLLETDR